MKLSALPVALKEWGRQSALYEWRQRRLGARRGPRISQRHGRLVPGESDTTFVMICGSEFDQAIPNAATMSRMGWCHGFEELGIPYVLLSAFELASTLPAIRNPMCWIAGSDYVYLNEENFRCLKRHPHAVLVSTAFKGDTAFFDQHGYPQQSWPRRLRERILSSDPRFLFTMSAESRFDYYEGWLVSGARLVSLPLACDTHLYRHPAHVAEFDSVDLAFVGGFWPYKGRQFDIYLKPFSDRLHVFGYSPWPYGNYRGQLPDSQEGALYAQAKLSPVINEPHVCAMGVDINERVFKVLGAGGLAITDATEGYRDWFTSDELLVPQGIDDYCDMVRTVLANPGSFAAFRERGRQAVLSRHTYRHRAEAFCHLFDLEAPTQGDTR